MGRARAASWPGPSRLHVNQEAAHQDRYLESGRNISSSFPGCQPHELLRMDWLKIKLSSKLREIKDLIETLC